MLLARHSALVKFFELSSWPAALVGPKALKPAALRSSTTPAAIAASGPTTTKSTALRLQKSITAGWSAISIGDTFGVFGDAGIAGRAPQFGQQRGSGDLPRQSVFAAAGTEQEDVHEVDRMQGFEAQSVAQIAPVLQGDGRQQRPLCRGVSAASRLPTAPMPR